MQIMKINEKFLHKIISLLKKEKRNLDSIRKNKATIM